MLTIKIKQLSSKLKSVKIKFENYLFESVFTNQLKRKIKNDLIPNDYKVFDSLSEIENWAKSYVHYFNDLRSQVKVLNPPKDKALLFEVLSYYAGRQHAAINDYHRGKPTFGPDDYIRSRSNIIEKEISRFQLSENVFAIRRIENRFAPSIRESGKNTIIKDPGFMSTSLNLNYRLDIESDFRFLKEETLMLIKIPKGTNALYLSPIRDRGEYELLLQRNLSYRIEKETTILGNRLMFIEIVLK